MVARPMALGDRVPPDRLNRNRAIGKFLGHYTPPSSAVGDTTTTSPPWGVNVGPQVPDTCMIFWRTVLQSRST